MNVPFLDLARETAALRAELDAAIARVLDSGRFVLSDEVEAFEAAFAAVLRRARTRSASRPARTRSRSRCAPPGSAPATR